MLKWEFSVGHQFTSKLKQEMKNVQKYYFEGGRSRKKIFTLNLV